MARARSAPGKELRAKEASRRAREGAESVQAGSRKIERIDALARPTRASHRRAQGLGSCNGRAANSHRVRSVAARLTSEGPEARDDRRCLRVLDGRRWKQRASARRVAGQQISPRRMRARAAAREGRPRDRTARCDSRGGRDCTRMSSVGLRVRRSSLPGETSLRLRSTPTRPSTGCSAAGNQYLRRSRGGGRRAQRRAGQPLQPPAQPPHVPSAPREDLAREPDVQPGSVDQVGHEGVAGHEVAARQRE